MTLFMSGLSYIENVVVLDTTGGCDIKSLLSVINVYL